MKITNSSEQEVFYEIPPNVHVSIPFSIYVYLLLFSAVGAYIKPKQVTVSETTVSAESFHTGGHQWAIHCDVHISQYVAQWLSWNIVYW